jgi:hypothetical protein
LERCRQDVSARAKRAAIRKLMQNGGYRLTILTAVAEKASIFSSSLKKLDWPVGLRTEVVVIPKLINAVANLRAAGPEPAVRKTREVGAAVHNGNGRHSHTPSESRRRG